MAILKEVAAQLAAWCSAAQTLFLEVYVVLGKALINGLLTVEGKWRLHESIHVTHTRRRPDVHPVVIFTGWAGNPPASRSEGELLAQFFRFHNFAYGFQWPGVLISEEEARTTVGNTFKAMNILEECAQEVRKQFPDVRIVILRFHLLSSDYHVDRTWEVDEELPELSDLEPLRKKGRQVCKVRTPYLFVACGDRPCEWLAEGYLALHRLSLLQTNLLGLGGNLHLADPEKKIQPGTIHELRRVPFETLGHTIRVLTGLQSRPVKQAPPGSRKDKMSRAMELLPAKLEEMQTLERQLARLVGKPWSEVQCIEWATFQKSVDGILYPLRTEVLDPDQEAPGF